MMKRGHMPYSLLRRWIYWIFTVSVTVITPLIISAQEMTFDGIEFVKITGDGYIFGSPTTQQNRGPNERQKIIPPLHDYWIGKYEVSQAQWFAVMGHNPSSFSADPLNENYPVESVSWNDVQLFIEALNQQAGDQYYRLPTEAEWEYAAKASSQQAWSFGSLENLLADYAHRDGVSSPRTVGLKLPNTWGIYDLYGNVSEWCQDWYQVWPSPSLGSCPPPQGEFKVIKGGANAESSKYLRSSSRNLVHPSRRSYAIGFRLVRVMDPANDQYRIGETCQEEAFCGNGVINDQEECDDGNLSDDDSCRSDCTLTEVNGDLGLCLQGQHVVNQTCTPCSQGTTRPAGDSPNDGDTLCLAIGCGDGVINNLEECDQGPLNSDLYSDSCRSDCTLPRCGDGVLDSGEECDDQSQSDTGFCSSTCTALSWSIPTLILLIDFSDTSFSSNLNQPEAAWADLMFGNIQGQGNHYWNEMFEQRFSMSPAQESAGIANNGVIHVSLSTAAPTGADRHVVEDTGWIQEALNQASTQINFDAYDQNGDGALSQQELSILTVLNTSFQHISGAGAQANIPLDHTLPGSGLLIPHFTRTLASYSSIGVNLHEFGHHFFALKHIAHPNDHELMGVGAYNEDPVISRLTATNDHWGTRPAYLTAFSRMRIGSTTPKTVRVDSETTTLSIDAVSSGKFQSIKLPTEDGYILLSNRHAHGYDTAIPYCHAQGGLVITEVAQYIMPLDLSNLDIHRESIDYIKNFDFCTHYATQGHNDRFEFGGYRFHDLSPSGPTMTVKVERISETRLAENYKWRWFKLDPNQPNYRLWWHERAEPGLSTEIDFDEVPDGDNPSGYFTMLLNAYYDTNEIRSVNSTAIWSTSDPYVSLNINPVTGGPGTTVGDAIVQVVFEMTETCPTDRTALITANVDGTHYSAKLTNIPCH